ncbi:MAG: DUF952 domain-containing protein [Paracoccaceae bacterium]
MVYKILRGAEWRALEISGATRGSAADVADGFVHLSTAAQVAQTAARHFAGETGLVLLALDGEALDNLRWEPSRGGALFPHLYAVLRLGDALWSRPLPLEGGTHAFPDGLR